MIKIIRIFTLMSLFALQNVVAQHTFSIVAVDPLTGEIGNAGATCLDIDDLGGEEGALVISDIILNAGAISSQAAWNPINQAAARERMELGESPQEIIDWLVANDPAPGTAASRQYGIVDLLGGVGGTPRSAAFTGNQNGSVANDIIGTNYAIQGNILLSQDVLDDMEAGFLNTPGTLADKLMGALQGAKRIGAQTSCTSNQTSSKSAFLRVAKIEDLYSNYGHLTVDLNVSKTDFAEDPIDVLQDTYDFYLANSGIDCPAAITTLPYTEGFEDGLGSWTQNNNDLSHVGSPVFDWTENTGTTTTTGTGPEAAFEGQTYLFTEASGANVGFPAKRAVLNSPCFNFSTLTEVYFTFNYHMLGNNVGNLSVRVNDLTGWTTVWLEEGTQGENWQTAVIDLSAYAGQSTILQLRIDSTTGLGERSDVAIDNVRVGVDVLNTDANALQSIQLTPNPTSSQITVGGVENIPLKMMTIYNVLGKEMMRFEVLEIGTVLNVEALATAMYFVKIETEKGVVIKKLIKE